jgi:hypothetical protein
MNRTPIDRGEQSLSAYLLKILTVLVKQSGGEIRIDATEMLDDLNGDGLSKSYDRDKRQLVLRYLTPGSEVFLSKDNDQWQSNSNSPKSPAIPSQRSSIAQPLHQSDLMGDSTLANERLIERSASTLDDSRIADLEDHLRKEAAARIVANFPSTPVIQPRDRPLSPRQNPQPMKVQRQFFKG